jgi:predicted NBD/HSP70 family sugar kinase
MRHKENIQPVMAEHINRLNKIMVLNIIRQEKKISRADIVKKSGLSAPTVTRIIDSLIQVEELVEQVGIGESNGGRPPVLVRFNSEGNYVIGIDWGRTHLHGVIANLSAETIFNLDIPISPKSDFDDGMKILSGLVNTLILSSGIESKKILGIGLAVAGFVNNKNYEVEFSPNFGWNKVDIQTILHQKFHVPVLVDNVTRVMSLGEFWYGGAREMRNFIFVNVGYGIGSGIIIDGKPYKGTDGFAGEIGHNKIQYLEDEPEHQRICACGKTDCLECYASGRGIAQTVREKIAGYPGSLIYGQCNGNLEGVTAEMVSIAAKSGDVFARKILDDVAVRLGTAFASVANTLNPEAVIIGGKVANSGDFFIKRLKEVFYQETLPHVSRQVEIFKSELIGEGSVKGAVALILKEVLDLNVKK